MTRRASAHANRSGRAWGLPLFFGAVALALYLAGPPPLILVAASIACGFAATLRPHRPRYGFSSSRGRDAVEFLLYGGPAIGAYWYGLGWLGLFQALAFVGFGATLRREERDKSLEGQLQMAIEAGHTAMAKSLIDQGASLEREVGGETPLAWAVLWGNLELVKYLLNRGADIHQRTGEGTLIDTANLGRGEASAADRLRYDELIEFLNQEMSRQPAR